MALRVASLALLGLLASASVAELPRASPDEYLLPEALLADDACAGQDEQEGCSLALLQRSGLRAGAEAAAAEVGAGTAVAKPVAKAVATVAKSVAKPLEAEDQASVPADGFIFALEGASGTLRCLSKYLPMGYSEAELSLMPGCNGLGAGTPVRFTWYGRGAHPGSGKLQVVPSEPCSCSQPLCLAYSSDLGLLFAECGSAQWWTASKGDLQTGDKCLRTADGSFKLEDCTKKASEPQHFYALQPKDMACVKLGCQRYCSYDCKAVGSSN